MESYRDALAYTVYKGERRDDRTGVGTRSVFGLSMRFENVSEEFPLLTGKRTHWPSIIAELCWFLRGDTNVEFLHDHGCTIWDEWADENGDLGPIYGAQWRDFEGVDQIVKLQQNLIDDPFSRRHVVSAWNPADLHLMALPPCHRSFQVYLTSSNALDMLVDMRSADMFLGVPFNIASYAALMHILAWPIKATPRNLTLNIGDAHVYQNHVDQTYELLERAWPKLPTLKMHRGFAHASAHMPKDFEIVNYNPLPGITAEVAV